jgi:hypothetical protein
MSAVSIAMRVRRWHWGKVVILWAWGGTLVALLLSTYLATRVEEDPGLSALTLLGSLLVLLALTSITWVWLSGRETEPGP